MLRGWKVGFSSKILINDTKKGGFKLDKVIKFSFDDFVSVKNRVSEPSLILDS